jgi:hypothetical protein
LQFNIKKLNSLFSNIKASGFFKESKINSRMSNINSSPPAEDSLMAKPNFKSNFSILKHTFLEWSAKVDINCCTKMFDYKGNYYVQCIWFVILLLSTGATFFLIAKSITDYLAYEVTSQIRIINEKPIQFPTVTFCDNNPFSSLKAEEFMQNISATNNLTPNSFENNWLIFNLAKLKASSNYLSEEDRNKFGIQTKPFCYFNSMNCLTKLHTYWSYEYGKCLKFNSGLNASGHRIDLENISRSGNEFGLLIGVIPFVNQNSLMTTSSIGGVVFVHESKFEPTDGVFVESRKNTFISIKKTITKKYPSPYSDCINLDAYKSDLYDYITITQKKAYRQQDCFELCIQRQIIDKCQCYYTKYVDLGTGVRPCLNITDYTCGGNSYNNFNLDECQTNSCPLECDSTTFDLSLSSLEYPDEKTYELYKSLYKYDDYYLKEFNLTLTYELFKSNVAFITVYYPNLQYTEITESPKTTLYDLFTQIGGSLGMFVSFSVFTLFEFIEIAILCLKDAISFKQIKPNNLYFSSKNTQ